MANLLPERVVLAINKALGDKTLSKPLRDGLLEELAADGFNAVFPEGIASLSAEAAMARWNQVIAQLGAEPNKDAILRILESRVSGERFYWLDKCGDQEER